MSTFTGDDFERVLEHPHGGSPARPRRDRRRHAATAGSRDGALIALVAGESLTADATLLAREMAIWQVTDGQIVAPAA